MGAQPTDDLSSRGSCLMMSAAIPEVLDCGRREVESERDPPQRRRKATPPALSLQAEAVRTCTVRSEPP